MHSARLEPVKIILVGAWTTYCQATGDARTHRNVYGIDLMVEKVGLVYIASSEKRSQFSNFQLQISTTTRLFRFFEILQ